MGLSRRIKSTGVAVSEVLTPALAVGQQVHYYPPAAPLPAGGLATIVAARSSEYLFLSYNGANVNAVRGATNGTYFGQPGTWDPLDMRHRRHLRIHGTHAMRWLLNFEADPTLLTDPVLPWAAGFVIDAIVQTHPDPTAYESLFDQIADKAAELGIPLNYGLLPVANFTSTADWWDPAVWEARATQLERFEALLKSRTGTWLHCQMETTEPALALTQVELDAAGVSTAAAKAAMQPYLDAIRATGKTTIVRPCSKGDLAHPWVVEAGGPGSVYCNEINTVIAKAHRQDELFFERYIGESSRHVNRLRPEMPSWARYVPLHVETELRMPGVVLRENQSEESEYIPICELVELVDGWVSVALHGNPVSPPYVGTRDWYKCTVKANSGTMRPSANDAFAVWHVAGGIAGNTVETSPKRCVGTSRGTAGQVGLRPWRRAVPGIDVNLTPAIGTEGFTCQEPSANDARCWRIQNMTTTMTSFALAFSFIARQPPQGTTYAIAGQGQDNSLAGAWNLIIDGSGQLAMNVNRTSTTTSDAYVIDAAPVFDVARRYVIGYDAAQGKWLMDTLGYQTTPTLRSVTANAILIGGTPDLPNRLTTVWGHPNGVIPYGTDVILWDRALTAEEATSAREHTWPYNYGFF